MDEQLMIVIAFVMVSVAYLARSMSRAWFGGGSSCQSVCRGCARSTTTVERPEANQRIALTQI
jgi:hypothetical protein